MDEHQRRTWGRMLEQVDAYDAGDVTLAQLVTNLQGLLGATDLRDDALVREFWNHEAPIDMELELRTENWAPPGSANDDNLRGAIADYRVWASNVLATTDNERS
jgi:hypothetical protein